MVELWGAWWVGERGGAQGVDGVEGGSGRGRRGWDGKRGGRGVGEVTIWNDGQPIDLNERRDFEPCKKSSTKMRND